MGDSYVECLVEREKDMGMFILRGVLFVAAGICLIMGILGMPVLLVFAVACVLIGVFLVPDSEIEYEYLYLGKELTIDKIIKKSRRKSVATLDLNKMEFMCPYRSHELDSHKNKKTPVKDFSAGKSDENPYVIVYHDEKGDSLVYITPNTELLKAIKDTMLRKVIEY